MTDTNRKGIVFDIQSFCTHDGPGIRTNIFLKGCPLECLWCANPEGQEFMPELFYLQQNCAGCLKCKAACPYDAIEKNNEAEPGIDIIKIDRKKCLTCDSFACVEACPNEALRKVGKLMSVDEVMHVVRRDQPFYKRHGGITLSGGDPLSQPNFTLAILKACKEIYVNTAMETEAFGPYKRIEEIFPYVDFFLCDIKVMDEADHIKATGKSNKSILENISKMAAIDAGKILIRVPIIPGFTDSEENMGAIADFCKKNGLSRVHILPYHKLGETKFKQLGEKYPMPDADTPTSERMEQLQKIVEERNVVCVIG